MRLRRRKLLLLSVLLLGTILGASLWNAGVTDEPTYGGKKLSVWLNELAALSYSQGIDPNTAQAVAVRAIGTNAIPWLLKDLKKGAGIFECRFNQVLQKQNFIKYRFPAEKRSLRAFRGFYALGPLAEPVIPDLLKLLEHSSGSPGPDLLDGIGNSGTSAFSDPRFAVPDLLVGIGAPAFPALQQCLTNTSWYSSAGVALIPGITIGAIYNAIALGRISQPEATIFVPAIQGWAQSSNRYAVAYANRFLTDWHLPLSPAEELPAAWKRARDNTP